MLATAAERWRLFNRKHSPPPDHTILATGPGRLDRGIIDLVMVSMFIASVVLAIFAIKRKDLASHVQWMMASVFFVLSPAVGRMLGIAAITINQGNTEGITLVSLAVPSFFVMISLIVFYFYKFGSFRHPASLFLVAAHIPSLFVEQIGDNPAVRSALSALFK